EFERLEVWELVSCPDNVFLIKLKWIYKVKTDEFGGVIYVEARLVASTNTAIPRGIFINQSKYASEIVKKYGMRTSDSVPMVEKSKLDKDLHGNPVDATLYRGMIGPLMYMTSSRPDLIYAVCLCARYQAKPTEKHLNAMQITWGVRTLDAVHQKALNS
ncbi:hypothetical protein Tco_0220105, partial [Tanacetum coccineum]